MTNRRRFLAGLVAAGLCPAPGWAALGDPRFLAAAQLRSGAYLLCGLSAEGALLFEQPLPARGHAAAAHPQRAEAVAFARRPGNFALVIDCRTGALIAQLAAPRGRHFYGHGAFSADGTRLYTTENDFERGIGRIGIWDAARGYARLGEAPSGGIGPHDIALRADGGFVVANGGIETHPDSGRTKLNIPTMRPNLAYLSAEGALEERIELSAELHQNSIRHLALAPDGQVGFAMQWQGASAVHPPLLGLHRRGEAPRLLAAPDAHHRTMAGYAGSIAFDGRSGRIAISSPRGDQTQIFDSHSGTFVETLPLPDVCGLASLGDGFVQTSGTGAIRLGATQGPNYDDRRWDNHLIVIPAS